MRRTISLALLIAFGWMLIAPALAPDAEANLPPCCRRHGKHHCMMRMMEGAGGVQPGFSSITEKCPYCPIRACATHFPTFKPEPRKQICAEPDRESRWIAHTQGRFRPAFLSNGQKRGPPTPLA